MKKVLLVILLAGLFSINSFAQDEMQKWMEYMTPGKEHQEMADMNGEWVYTSKMWMNPSAPPTESTGTALCEMILGGRYSQMTANGSIMGMEFTGISITGYDNAKKIWMSIWVDNFGTGILYMEGKKDESTGKYVYTGKTVDPMTGNDMAVKQTIKMVDKDTYEMEMFIVVDGKDIKNMELVYKRK